MDNEINLYMGTATFFVDMEASGSRATHKGQFKVRCILSPIEFINSDSLYRELLGKTNPEYATEYVSSLCYALSQLRYRIMECPAWFKNETRIDGSHVDDAILLSILNSAVECESDYRKQIEEKYSKAKGEVVSAIDDGTLNDGKQPEPEEQDDSEAVLGEENE